MQWNPLTVFIFAAAIILTWVARATYIRRDRNHIPAAGSALLFSFVVWSVGYGMMLLVNDYDAYRFWNTVRFAGMVVVPPLWFMYVFGEIKPESQLSPLVLILLWAVSPLTYLLIATNDAHHLMWVPLAPEATRGLLFFQNYEIGFQLFALHSYIVGLISTVLLAVTVLRSHRLFRMRGLILVVGLLSIAGAGYIQLSGLSASPELDFSWLMAAIFGPVIALGFNRLRREDIKPVVYEHVVHSMQDAVLVVDQKHVVMSMNKVAEKLFQMRLKDALNQPAEAICASYNTMQTGGEEAPDGSRRLAITLDQRTLDVTVSPMRDVGGKIVSRVIVMRDITQRVKVEKELRRHKRELSVLVAERTQELEDLNQELLKLSDIKDQFISDMSHELRTPITSIKLYLKLLDANPDNIDKYILTLGRETERLRQLVEGLLTISRLDQARIAIELETLDVNQLVTDFVHDRRILAEERCLDLQVDLHSATLTAQADCNAMDQIFNILVTNAINYTPDGGRVLVTSLPNGDRVGISVTDNGIGIVEKDMAHLFERFYRGDGTRELGIPGTGLGLAIAWELMALQGGSIEVHSEGLGKGATFTVWLEAVPEVVA